MVKRILKLGFPTALQWTIASISWLVVLALINQHGVTISAANGVSNKIRDFCQLFISALTTGGGTMCAQCLGARLFDRAEQVMKTCLKLALALAAVIIVVAELFAPQFSMIFTPDPEVQRWAVINLRIEIICQLFYAAMFAYNTLATGSGHTMFVMWNSFLNCIEGVMHTGQRDMIRIRVSKADFEAGFRFRHIGEVLYAKIKSEFDTVVDKCQVKIVVDEAKNKELRAMANEVFNRRDDRLRSMTDESVPVFYTCIMCQAFSPSHVCIVTPERLGLCGAVSWLDAKATNELDPQGPCQVVPKEHCIDERLGRYEDVDEAVQKYSHGALEHVTLYSLFQDPMTSCGCFECICGVEPVSMGVVITMREYAGMTPLGMTFSEMASMTGGGVQTPGFMGHGKHFIASKKFMKAEGGIERIVWMPKELKEQMRDKLNEAAKELYDVDNFADMIADETICTEDPEELLNYLTEVGHPVLSMEPFDM